MKVRTVLTFGAGALAAYFADPLLGKKRRSRFSERAWSTISNVGSDAPSIDADKVDISGDPTPLGDSPDAGFSPSKPSSPLLTRVE